MEREDYLAKIKPRMPEKRYIHTLGVTETAIQLTKRFGEDEKRAETAAILHDVAKYADAEWMKEVIVREQLEAELLHWHTEIQHGPVGAVVARDEFGVTDEDILNAIRHHTTGRAGMTTLEKIIYVADMIEPNRKFDGVERLREIASRDLDEAIKACVRHTLSFLVATGQPIYPLSIVCYNDLMRED